MIFLFLLAAFWIFAAAPTAHWLDVSELALAGASLGVGHPPGQPLHALSVGLFQLLPFGDASFRSALASILFAVLSAWGAWRLARRWGGAVGRISLGITGAIALSWPVTVQATRCEVYALATAGVLWAIEFISIKEDARCAALGWLFWSLAMVTHPVMGLTALPFLLRSHSRRSWFWAAAGAAVLIYLPLRASSGAAWKFGDPTTWNRFFEFIRGKLYKGYGSPGVERFVDNLQGLGTVWIESFTWACVALGIVGLLIVAKRQRLEAFRAFGAIGISILLVAVMGNFWTNNPDRGGYLGPGIWIFAALAMIGGEWVVRRSGRSVARIGISFIVAVWGVVALKGTMDQSSISADYSAHEHLISLAEEVPAGSRVHLASFSTFSLLRYGQVMEGLRPDLELIYRGLKSSTELDRSHPSRPESWELAMVRGNDGAYTLRAEDIAIESRLFPSGWFCRVGDASTTPLFEEAFRTRTRKILGEVKVDYAREPLILSYVVHVLLASLQKNHQRKAILMHDASEMFPGIVEEEGLRF